MPEKMSDLWENQLQFEGKVDGSGVMDLVGKITVKKGHKIGAPKPLFRRIDDDYLKELTEHFSNSLEVESLFKK